MLPILKNTNLTSKRDFVLEHPGEEGRERRSKAKPSLPTLAQLVRKGGPWPAFAEILLESTAGKPKAL